MSTQWQGRYVRLWKQFQPNPLHTVSMHSTYFKAVYVPGVHKFKHFLQ